MPVLPQLNFAPGYIRFNHFIEPVDKAFSQALAQWGETRGLIVDVRNNPGGYFRTMDRMLKQLITEKATLYRLVMRGRSIKRMLDVSMPAYANPVVVLIDETSMSTSELFAACLQVVGRATIIGNRSPGYLLGAQWKRLPNGLSFMYPFLQPIPADGRIIEGNGVKPDIEVALDRDSLLLGVDTQLEAAMRHLLR